jgi:hypothetical protein
MHVHPSIDDCGMFCDQMERKTDLHLYEVLICNII